MTGRLVLVESNTTGTGRQFVRRGVEMGLRPVLLAADPDRYDLRDVVPESLRVDTNDPAAVARACRGLGETAGIVSSSEYFVPVVAEVADRLGLPGPSADAVRVTRDKGRQRRLLAVAGVPQPEFVIAGTPGEAREALVATGLPAVVKPVTGSGSIGVLLCRTSDEVTGHAERLLTVTHNERGHRIPARVLVEQAVTGPEFSVEVFGGQVVGITRKHLGRLPRFVETGHDFPAPVGRSRGDRLTAVALAATRALGLDFGAAHVEVRESAAGPVVVEVNPRLAGGLIPRLVAEATGVDLITATLLAAVGEPPRLTADRARSASIRFVVAPRGGTLSEVRGAAAARRQPQVIEVDIYRPDNTPVSVTGDFRDRLGHVLAVADRAALAEAAADSAIRLIKPVVSAARVAAR
ncbi:ATP-grasp domain-containing protein [Amycolatopsis sp. cmx-11-12]|uniref:ATP-grasp domain-containing protein n=1 Tax=Amycolatopsis sp. cmx-11-12 TaxID=2785795 RepID=UPI0039170E0B